MPNPKTFANPLLNDERDYVCGSNACMSKFAFLAVIILRNILWIVYRNESKTIPIYKVNKCDRNYLSLASYGILIYISTLGDHFCVLSPSRNENSRTLKNLETLRAGDVASKEGSINRRGVDECRIFYFPILLVKIPVSMSDIYPVISVRVRWLRKGWRISIAGRSRDPASRPRFGENL